MDEEDVYYTKRDQKRKAKANQGGGDRAVQYWEFGTRDSERVRIEGSPGYMTFPSALALACMVVRGADSGRQERGRTGAAARLGRRVRVFSFARGTPQTGQLRVSAPICRIVDRPQAVNS
jgi:hypothetical protein